MELYLVYQEAVGASSSHPKYRISLKSKCKQTTRLQPPINENAKCWMLRCLQDYRSLSAEDTRLDIPRQQILSDDSDIEQRKRISWGCDNEHNMSYQNLPLDCPVNSTVHHVVLRTHLLPFLREQLLNGRLQQDSAQRQFRNFKSNNVSLFKTPPKARTAIPLKTCGTS